MAVDLHAKEAEAKALVLKNAELEAAIFQKSKKLQSTILKKASKFN